MKKILLSLLAASLMTINAGAQLFEVGSLRYHIISKADLTVQVYSYMDGIPNDCIIPPSVTYDSVKYSVVRIGDGAFADCIDLHSISLPKSLAEIGRRAFFNCTSLQSISVEFENPYFSSADGILFNKEQTTIIAYPTGKSGEYNISNHITAIGDYAFYACSKLTSIDIPISVCNIGEYAFGACNALKEVSIAPTDNNIPNSATTISDYAFAYCPALSSIFIPNSVQSIGSAAFKGCSSLSSITLPNQLTEIQSWSFSDCTALTSVTIPNSVKIISDLAFLKCTALSSLDIPNSVTEIGYQAFWGCSALHSVNVDKGNQNYSSTGGVVFNKEQTAIILYPPGKTGPYTIPNSVTGISDHTFENCNKLTSVIIPNSVKRIGNSAFKSCSSLASISMSDSINELEIYAFCDCTELISISIPNTITNIKDNVFSGCSSLTSVSLPKSLTHIGAYAFNNCTTLSSIVIPQNVAVIYSRAFNGCIALDSIYALSTTPPNVGRSAFTDTPRDAVIFIPAGSASLYSTTGEWRYFSNFCEMGTLDLSLSVSNIEMGIGETAELIANVNKDPDVNIVSQIWYSSKPQVADIDEYGVITAKSIGKTTIFVVIVDNYGLTHTDRCDVTVTSSTGIEETTLDFSNPAAQYYNIYGIPVNDTNLTKGIYFILSNGNCKKILIQ